MVKSNAIRVLIVFCFFPRWLNPLFWIGYKRRLEEDDMYEVLEEDRSEKLGQDLNRYEELFSLLSKLRTNGVQVRDDFYLTLKKKYSKGFEVFQK